MMCGVSTAAVCLDLSCADTVAYPERVMLTDMWGVLVSCAGRMLGNSGVAQLALLLPYCKSLHTLKLDRTFCRCGVRPCTRLRGCLHAAAGGVLVCVLVCWCGVRMC